MTAPRPWKDLGDRIKAAREAAGLSRRELSLQVNTAEHSIYRWEGGLHRPETDNLYAIAQACGVTVEELMGSHQRGDIPGAFDEFLETPKGHTVTDSERKQLLAMPWDRIPTKDSYFYALEAIRAQQSPDEAAASAEESEEMLSRGRDRGRRMLRDDLSQAHHVPRGRKR